MPITRVQGPKRGIAGNSSTLTVRLDSTPTVGNVIVAVIGTYGSYAPSVYSISQSGGNVNWQQQAFSGSDSLYGRRVEIWTGIVQGGTTQNLTITLQDRGSGANSDPVIADICEYNGLNTSSLKDGSNVATNINTPTLTTGSYTTTQANELWIGGIFNVCDQPNGDTDKAPTNGFTMFDGVGATYSQTKSLAYLEKIVSSTGSASCNVTSGYFPTYEAYAGCIVAFKGSTGSTIHVTNNGYLTGDGSKQSTITYTGASTIIQVDSNVPSNLNNSAVIENLIIDGTGGSNTTGILLENVYNCYIRNVTIMNCDVGIKVTITGSGWSQANRFEHIRMINVKQGIVFQGTSTNKDFSYTTIDDVGISLISASPVPVGIQVGPYANLYGSFIKATVWILDTSGVGMNVQGEVKLSLVNLEAEASSGTPIGVHINSGAIVNSNQSFALAALGISNKVQIDSGSTDIITTG